MSGIDERIILWINDLVGKSSVLDRIMIWLASDYFIPVTISLILLAIWFLGQGAAERENYQRAVICAFITIGFASGFVLAANHIYSHEHPFEALPDLKAAATQIFYEIHDPAFPSNTAAVTFSAAAGLWQKSRKLGYLMLIPAVLMPLSKIYAAIYWPSDIVAGAVLAILTSFLISWVVMPLAEPMIGRFIKITRKLCLA